MLGLKIFGEGPSHLRVTSATLLPRCPLLSTDLILTSPSSLRSRIFHQPINVLQGFPRLLSVPFLFWTSGKEFYSKAGSNLLPLKQHLQLAKSCSHLRKVTSFPFWKSHWFRHCMLGERDIDQNWSLQCEFEMFVSVCELRHWLKGHMNASPSERRPDSVAPGLKMQQVGTWPGGLQLVRIEV